MQVGKILDAVVGSTTAGMVEASQATAADSEMAQRGPDAIPVPAVHVSSTATLHDRR